MDAVRVFTLKNSGAFVARMQICWSAGSASGFYEPPGYHDICEASERSIDMADAAGIPEGASVWLRAVIVGGRSRTAGERFTFSSRYNGYAVYTLKGTLFGSSLQAERINAVHLERNGACLYQCLYDGLASCFPALKRMKNMRFQFAASPMAANWSQTSYADFYGLADIAPGDTGDFYTVGSVHISQAYADLLGCLAGRLGEDDPEYQRLEDRCRTAAENYNQAVNGASDAFLLARQQGRTAAEGLDAWLETLEGRAWKRRLAMLEARMDSCQDAMSALVEGLRAPLLRAQAALLSDRMSYVDGAHSVVTVPRTVIGGNLQEDVGRWKQLLSSYRQGQKIGFDLSVGIAPDALGPAEGSGLDFERLILDRHYSMTLKAVGCNSYPILRGAWYDDTFVNRDMKTYKASDFGLSRFFGPDGALRLIPTTLIAVYHPLIELTVSADAYEDGVRKQLEGCGTLRFCGLAFDAPKASDVTKNGSAVTLTLEAPDTQQAQLIGVISADKTAAP